MSDEIRLEIPDEMSAAIKQTKINIEYEKSQIDTSLSDDEMREIINSLREEEQTLRDRRHAYEDYLNDKKQKRLLEERLKTIGKCYKRVVNRKPHYRGIDIFAFKILGNIKDARAECVVLLKGHDDHYTIKRDHIGVWEISNMYLREKIQKFINDFEEISEEEFLQLKQEWMEKILNDITRN